MAALPLNDDYPVRRAPVVAYALIAANVLVYLTAPQAATAVWYSPDFVERFCSIQDYFMRWGAVPAELLGTVERAEPLVHQCGPIEHKSVWLSLFSSMFVHGDALQLLGNRVYLFVFGPVVEDRVGRVRLSGLCAVTGLAAALRDLLSAMDGTVWMVGGSGASSGVRGDYLRAQ